MVPSRKLEETVRAEGRNTISNVIAVLIAEWIPDVNKAKVTKKVGKVWENFGHYSDDSDWLFPEEALLLLETNALQVVFNGVPLSIERAYLVLIDGKTGCTINEYRTFSHLVRLGYKLFRHSAHVSVTRYEKEIRLDQHVLQQKCCSSSNNLEKNTVNTVSHLINNDVNITNGTDRDSDILLINAIGITTDGSVVKKNTFSQYRRGECSSNKVVQIENEESVSGSDILSVASKDTIKSAAVQTNKIDEICIEDDDEIIEIPVDKEVVIINDATSSESDDDDDDKTSLSGGDENKSKENDDDDDSASVASKSSNSNWKRTSKSHTNEHDVKRTINFSEPLEIKYAVRTNYVTIDEFLFDSLKNTFDKDSDVIVLSDDDICVINSQNRVSDFGKELQRFYKEIEVIDVESDTDDPNKDIIKNMSRKDILNSFPCYRNGEIFIRMPPLSFLPPNVKPINKEYRMKFIPSDSISNSYNDWNDHKLSRNNLKSFIRSPRPYSRPYQGNRNRPVIPFYRQQQWNMFGNNAIQNQIRAMATGVMQVASTLLSLPFPLLDNSTSRQFYQHINNPYQSTACTNDIFRNNNVHSLVGPYFNNSIVPRSQNIHCFANRNEGSSEIYQSYDNRLPYTGINHDKQPDFYNRYDRNSNDINSFTQNHVKSYQNQRNANSSPTLIVANNGFDNRHQSQTDISHFDNTQKSIYESSGQQQTEYSLRNMKEIDSERKRCFDNRVGNYSNIENTVSSCSGISSRDYNNSRYGRSYRHSRQRRWRHMKRPASNSTKDQEIVIDTDGDHSVFVDDIPVKENVKQIENEDFIPFNSNRSVNNRNIVIDVGGKDFIVTDDIDNYAYDNDKRNRSVTNKESSWRRARRRGGRVHGWNRKQHIVCRASSGKRYSSRCEDVFNNTPSKKQKISDNSDGQQNKQTDIEMVCLPRIPSTTQNAKNKLTENKRKRYFTPTEKSEKINKQQKESECKVRRNLSNIHNNHSNSNVEVIDIELLEETGGMKTKDNDFNTIVSVKVETHNQNESAPYSTGKPVKALDCDRELLSNRIINYANPKHIHVKMEHNTLISNDKNLKKQVFIKHEIEPNFEITLGSTVCELSVCETNQVRLESNIKSEKEESYGTSLIPSSESTVVKTEQFTKLSSKEQVYQENNTSRDVNMSMYIKREIDPSCQDKIVTDDANSSENSDVEVRDQLNTHTVTDCIMSNESLGRELKAVEDISWSQLKQSNSVPIVEMRMATNGDEEDFRIRPIITATDCKSLETVLSALQIIGCKSQIETSGVRKFKVSYDVYVSKDTPIKKATRGLPDYRLVVIDFRDPLPLPNEVAELNYRFEDGVPILMGVVLPDSLSFFLMGSIDLPAVN